MFQFNIKGFDVFIDDEDYYLFQKATWKIVDHSRNGHIYQYVQGSSQEYKGLRLHRVIMDVSDPFIFVDHWNHNTLDNRKENLRVCTPSHNAANKMIQSGGTSIYKGVSKCFANKNQNIYWRASIKVNNRFKGKLFPFTDEGEIEAAKWYDEMAKLHFGEFALTNF